MKNLIFLFVFSFHSLLAQHSDIHPFDFGEGIVKVRMYAFPPEDSANDRRNKLSGDAFQYFEYAVYHHAIFRQNGSKNYKPASDSQGNIIISIFSPNCLIRYDSSLLYYYVYKDNHIGKILKYDIDSFAVESFFRKLPVEHLLTLSSYDSSRKYLINDFACYHATLADRATGLPVSVYFTREKMPVRSPLNVFFGHTCFPFNVVRIKFFTDWSAESVVLKNKGHAIFEIGNDIGPIKDTSIFSLPPGVPVYNDIPLYQELQKESKEISEKPRF